MPPPFVVLLDDVFTCSLVCNEQPGNRLGSPDPDAQEFAGVMPPKWNRPVGRRMKVMVITYWEKQKPLIKSCWDKHWKVRWIENLFTFSVFSYLVQDRVWCETTWEATFFLSRQKEKGQWNLATDSTSLLNVLRYIRNNTWIYNQFKYQTKTQLKLKLKGTFNLLKISVLVNGPTGEYFSITWWCQWGFTVDGTCSFFQLACEQVGQAKQEIEFLKFCTIFKFLLEKQIRMCSAILTKGLVGL